MIQANSFLKTVKKTVVSGATLFVLCSPAFAGGSLKDAPEKKACDWTANTAITSDYVFRGQTQTGEEAAVSGGIDVACGMFYAGVWASSVDFNETGGVDGASVETDIYAGIKPSFKGLDFDLGVLYYAYPGAESSLNYDYVEFKAGVSGKIAEPVTLGATVFYSPEYFGDTGSVWTVEGKATADLPKLGFLSPKASAVVGTTFGDDAAFATTFAEGDDSYIYWNAGVTFGFMEKFGLDLRYHDTNLEGDLSDERFVATLSANF